MTMPAQKPGKSRQDYGTPWELIRAVEARWGKLEIDLAASDENAKAPHYFTAEDDYLKQEFRPGFGLADDALCWCNPPFSGLDPWFAKWRHDSAMGARIIALTPASIGAEYFREHVCGGADEILYARVIALAPRIMFEGCDDPYPKDCMLTLWGAPFSAGFEVWRWK